MMFLMPYITLAWICLMIYTSLCALPLSDEYRELQVCVARSLREIC